MKKKSIYIILITTILFNTGYSQTILSLKDCIKILKEQNEDIYQSNINLLLANLDIKEAKNAYLPTLQLSANQNYNLGLAFDQIAGQLVTGDQWSNNSNVSINTTVPIFQGFKLTNNLKQSFVNVENIEIKKKKIEQSLKLELLTKYFETIANNSLHKVSIEQLDFAKKQLEQERVKFGLSVNTLVDVTQSESQVANSNLSSIINYYAYQNSLISLKQLLGLPLTDSIVLVQPNISNFTLDELLNNISDYEDPNVKLAHNSIRKTQLEMHYAKGMHYPSVFLFIGYGTNYSSERKDYLTGNYMNFFNQLSQNKNFNFGLSLSIPLFDGFKTKNNISRLKLDLQIKQSELRKRVVEKDKLIELATRELIKSMKEYQLLQVKHSALQKSFLAMQERYSIGVNTSIDYHKALLEYNISTLELTKAEHMLIFNGEVIRLLKGDI